MVGISPSLLDRQVAMLYQNTPMALALSYVGSLISLAVLHDVGDTARGLIWFAFATAAMLYRGALVWFRLRDAGSLSANTWARLMVWGNLAAGIQWALLGTWLFPTEHVYAQAFFVMVITAYVGGSIASYASVKLAYLALAVPATIAPVVYVFLIHSQQLLTGLMGLFFFSAAGLLAHRYHTQLCGRLQGEIDGEARSRQLNDTTSTLGQQCDILKHRTAVMKRSQAEARRRASSLSEHIGQTLLPVLEFDHECRVVESNRAARARIGGTEADLRGRTVADLFDSADAAEDIAAVATRCLAEATPLVVHAYLVVTRRQRHSVGLYFTPIRNEGGKLARLALVIVDAPAAVAQYRPEKLAAALVA